MRDNWALEKLDWPCRNKLKLFDTELFLKYCGFNYRGESN